MPNIAFLFSGQGAQHPGMGMEFYAADRKVKALFDLAETVRPGTLEQLSGADAETLRQTENTQPCLYLADLAAAIYLKNHGVTPSCAAGFSLGELPALAFAGAFSYEEGFRLVCERARLMGRESRRFETGMAAVLKLPNETVEEICSRYSHVYPVNYNSPGQLVISGSKEDLAGAAEDVKAAGGRIMPLNVSGSFHSPFMKEAAADFAAYLKTRESKVPAVPVYANRTAEPYSEAPSLSLASQIDHPVRWETTIRNMAAAGVTVFVEVGVGTVLQKLVQKILPGTSSFAAETPAQADNIVKEAGIC